MGESSLTGTGESTASQLTITDPSVCKSFLVGSCPHDVFVNTKGDLGTCKNVHSEALRVQYQEASDAQKEQWLGFEFDYLKDMQMRVEDCNRHIETAQRRLEKTPEEIRQTNALVRIFDLPP